MSETQNSCSRWMLSLAQSSFDVQIVGLSGVYIPETRVFDFLAGGIVSNLKHLSPFPRLSFGLRFENFFSLHWVLLPKAVSGCLGGIETTSRKIVGVWIRSFQNISSLKSSSPGTNPFICTGAKGWGSSMSLNCVNCFSNFIRLRVSPPLRFFATMYSASLKLGAPP